MKELKPITELILGIIFILYAGRLYHHITNDDSTFIPVIISLIVWVIRFGAIILL